MAGTWKTVRVFLSSTFRDMHAERDHLVKVTFPALRERLLPFRVELYDVDLRWGITDDEAKSEKVISLCLDQVDECRPFFLAFLGHRYGFAPGRVPEETQQRFPFVKQFPGVSVTELEVRYGALLHPERAATLVLLRNQEALSTIPEATRKRDFQEADPKLQQKLDALRAELEAGPLPVQPYAASWDPKRYDRVNRTEGKLVGLDDFGKQVEAWLWQAIRKELQLPDTPAEVDPLAAEADLHERFLETRTRIYVGRDDLYGRLREFALASGTVPLLLSGDSGLGKSAALARFVRDFRKERPDTCVLAHFVGASPRTTSLAGMLQRLTSELQRRFDMMLPTPSADAPSSADEVIRTFIVAITSLPDSARVVLVFDALNQLDADSRADTLIWLLEELPANVRVLCSSVTGPQQTPRVLTAFGQRQYVSVLLRPLTDDERRAIIKAVPRLVAKTLDDKQIDALLANLATQNPLFLIVSLEELRGYGSFDNLNKVIARLPREGDALTKLFERVFERLEKEFGQRLAEQVLSLLACARRGLSGPELVALTRSGEPGGSATGDSEELYPLLRQLEPYLQRRDGRYDFYHLSIRRAVELHYLKWEEQEDQHDPWLRWNPDRPSPASEPTEPERETRHRLIDFFETNRLAPRSVDELPWQLAQLRSWQRLFDLLGELPFFDTAWRANEFEVRTAWSLVKSVGGLEPFETYRDVLANPANHDRGALWRLAIYLKDSGHAEAVLRLWSFLIDHYRKAADESRVQGCLGDQATILRATGDLNEAMRLLKEQEAICRRLNDPAGLASSLGQQAVILDDIGDRDEAMRLHKEEEAICRRLNDPAALSGCLGNQATILRATGDLNEAMRLWKEQEAICRRLNDPAALSASLGNQAVILDDIGDLDGAMRLHKEQEATRRRLNDPAGLSRCLGNQALLLRATGDLDGATRLLKEQEAICRRLSDPAGLQASLGNQALLLQATGDLDGATRLLEEKEAICRRLNDPYGLQLSLGNQGVILTATGDLDGAMRLYKEQEAICRRLNDPTGLASSLGNQGLILQATGDLDESLRLLREQEAICRRLRNPSGLQLSLGNQGVILTATGDLDGAMRLYKEQEGMCRRLNDPAGLARSLGNQAVILQVTGDLEGAMLLHKEGEAICRRLNDPAGLARSLANQAEIRRMTGDLDGAIRVNKEVEAMCRRLNDPAGLARSLGNQAVILQVTGDLEGAMLLHKEEEAIYRRLNNPAGLARSLANQAVIRRMTGDLDGAMRVNKEVEAMCRRLNDAASLQAILGNQALILQATGDLDAAMRLHKEEEAICRRLNDPAGLARSLGNQGVILQVTGDLDATMRLLKEQEAICRRLNDPEGLAISLANQGRLLAVSQSRPTEGLPLAEEALGIAREHGFTALVRQIEPMLNEMRRMLTR